MKFIKWRVKSEYYLLLTVQNYITYLVEHDLPAIHLCWKSDRVVSPYTLSKAEVIPSIPYMIKGMESAFVLSQLIKLPNFPCWKMIGVTSLYICMISWMVIGALLPFSSLPFYGVNLMLENRNYVSPLTAQWFKISLFCGFSPPKYPNQYCRFCVEKLVFETLIMI